jgi:hypothetical protein
MLLLKIKGDLVFRLSCLSGLKVLVKEFVSEPAWSSHFAFRKS